MHSSVFPWQKDFIDTPPSSATIITGDAGIGAGELSLTLAHNFCGSGKGSANPDLLITLPVGNNISVDAIRHIVEFLSFAPVSRERRVALILRADNMHIAAANALLKTLEEPSADKALLLWSHTLQQLPATIISRCRVYHAPTPSPVEAEAYTAAHGGSAQLAFCANRPLAAAAYPSDWCELLAGFFNQGSDLDINSAVQKMNVSRDNMQHWQQVVRQYVNDGAHLNPHCLEWEEKSGSGDNHSWLEGLQKWIADGVRVASALPPCFFPNQSAVLQQLAGGKKRQWLNFYRHLLQRRAVAAHPLVKDLFIKEILYDYRRLCTD